jgi:hypothetical protein
MNKYEILIKILDGLKDEAPLNYTRYKPKNEQELINIRSRSFINLYLKVTFGILDFSEREEYITDDPYDGGIDGYFIDKEDKNIYYIQSKFRNNDLNFNNKDIFYDELLCMDIARIVRVGESNDEKGNSYNGRIIKMQTAIKNIPDLPLYNTKIIILANAKDKEKENIKKAIGGYDFELFNYEKTFKNLVFPIITSTFYNKEKLIIKINVDGTNNNRARSNIKTSYKDCNITMLLVPVKEIGRIMNMYKNSILKFNPRSFLSLQNNDVNRNISNAIKDIDSNDFALFNNGVTMLASNAIYSDETAEKGIDQLLLTNPQIINGGQTAYTLSQIYEDCKRNNNYKVLDSKSVVLKVITLSVSQEEKLGLQLIEKISKATNYQTPVEIQDRISNDEKQMELQRIIYNNYSYFYERKRGEYAEGISNKYITRDMVIEKTEFMRIFLACIGQPNKSRQVALSSLFSQTNLDKIEISNIPIYVYAYKCFELLKSLQKNAKESVESKYGNALRFGSYSIVYATILRTKTYTIDNVENDIQLTLSLWNDFENMIINKTHNEKYFREIMNSNDEKVLETNYSGYYRGTTLNNDLYNYFKI